MAPTTPGTRIVSADVEERRDRDEALVEMERALLAELDSTRFLQLLVESASQKFDALTGVWLVAGEGVVVERITSVPGTFPEGRVAFGEGMTGRCAATRRGLLVRDYPRWGQALPRYVAAGLRQAMAQPLTMGDRLLGVITMSRTGDEAAPFTESDLAGLERLAGLAALALRNAMLYEEAVRRRRHVEVLADAERELVGELGRERLLRLIVQRAGGLFDAGAAVYLLRGDELVPAEQASADVLNSPIPLHAGVCGRCAASRHGMLANDYAERPEAIPDMVARGVTHVIAQPLLVHDQLLGVIAAGRTGADAVRFIEDDLEALGHFARHAAIAVANATLYEEAQRRREEAEALAQVAHALTGMRDVDQIAARLLEAVRDLLGSHRAAVGMLQADGGLVMLAVHAATLSPGQVLHPDVGLVTQAMRDGCVVATSDILSDPRLTLSERRRKNLTAGGIRAAAAVPLRSRDRTIGALMVGFPDCRVLTEDERRLAQALADGAALALENARLYQEADRRRREAEVAAQIAATINASLDLDDILQQVAEGARALCQSDVARIALHDPQLDAVVFRYWVNTRYEGYETVRLRPGTGGLGGLALRDGRPMRTDDWMADPRFSKEMASVVQAEGVTCQMVVPIYIGEAIEGLLYVDNRSARPFTDLEESALVQLAGHAALAIRNARLFAAVQAAGTRLQAVSSRLLEVQEAERRHLARELHDEIGQALTAVKINLQMLRRLPDMSAAAGRLDDSLAMLNRILEGVRELSLDLRPSLLDDLGLAAALRWYVGAQAQRAGLTAEVSTGTLPEDLSAAIATTAFRIVQEAVTNVVRHARATRIDVTVECVGGGLVISVGDDGTGFDVAAARRRALAGGSLGLLGLEERVHLAGGLSSIESTSGGLGTTVRAWLPLATPSVPRTEAPDGTLQ
jgi:signal transduction histidine kinase